MKNILVSGASGIIGYGILRSLRMSSTKYRLLGTSIYIDSVAEAFCDVFEKAVLTSEQSYISWLKEMIKKHKIEVIIPGIEVDMYKWLEHYDEIKSTGVNIVMNNHNLISLCKDKWNFYQILLKYKSPFLIETTLDSNYSYLVEKFGLPFILKPRSSHGSKGIVIVHDEEVFNKNIQNIGSILMVQPIIGNDNEEYTTSAFCDGIGAYSASITLKRRLSKDGFTEKAEVVDDVNFRETLLELCSVFKPLGPTNFQFRKQDGHLKLLEINPRISSSTSIRSKFGYNESEFSVRYFSDNIMPEQPYILKGKAIRYIEDAIIYE